MKAHFDAVKAFVADAGVPVESAARVDSENRLIRANYVVLYPSGPDLVPDRYSEIQRPGSRHEFLVPGKVVAVDPDGVNLIMDRVIVHLVGEKLTVPGWDPQPMRVEIEDLQPDWSVRPPLYFVDFWVKFVSQKEGATRVDPSP